jgi:hypothetical protein
MTSSVQIVTSNISLAQHVLMFPIEDKFQAGTGRKIVLLPSMI